jgi:hypothetical protein
MSGALAAKWRDSVVVQFEAIGRRAIEERPLRGERLLNRSQVLRGDAFLANLEPAEVLILHPHRMAGESPQRVDSAPGGPFVS